MRTTSLALEYEWTPEGRFAAVAGAGYASHDREGAVTEDDVNFLLGASYSLGAATTLRGSVAHQIRFPTLRDLYGVDRGNPELSPERTLNYEVALEHEIGTGALLLELVLFRIDADDFLQRTPNDVLRNTEETRFQGVELRGRHRFERDTRLSWSYTYLDAENRSPEAEITKTQNRPEHKIALAIDHEAAYGLRLRGDVLYAANSYALSRATPVRAMELGDYAVVGLGLSRALRSGRPGGLRVFGRVTNLFDTDYAESIGFPGVGRTALVGFELRTGG